MTRRLVLAGHCGTYAPTQAPTAQATPTAAPSVVPTREPHYTVRVGFYPDDAPLPYMGGVGAHAFDDYTYTFCCTPRRTTTSSRRPFCGN